MSRLKKFISRPENAIFLMMTIMTLFVFITVILNIFYYHTSLIEFEEFKAEYEHIRTDESTVSIEATPIYSFVYVIEKLGLRLFDFFGIKIPTLIGLISHVFTTFLRLILIRKNRKTLLAYRIIASLYYLAAILVTGLSVLGVIFRFMEGELPVLRAVFAVVSAVFIVICMRKTFSKKLAEVKENEKVP